MSLSPIDYEPVPSSAPPRQRSLWSALLVGFVILGMTSAVFLALRAVADFVFACRMAP